MKFKRSLAALIAVTTIFTTVGCGKNSGGDAPDSTVTAEQTTAASTEIETTAEPTTEPPYVEDDSIPEEEKIAAALRDMYKAAQENDNKKLMRRMLPDELAEQLKDVNGYDFFAEYMNGIILQKFAENGWEIYGGGSTDFDVSDLEITRIDDIVDNAADDMSAYYSFITATFKEMAGMGYDMKKYKDGGYSDAESEKIADHFVKMKHIDDIDAVEKTIGITDVKRVYYTNPQNDSSSDMYLYKVQGQGWKVDYLISELTEYYISTKRETAINAAYSLCKAANSAATELDEDDVNIPGQCIISSESSMTKIGSNCRIDVDEFKEYMAYYIDEEKLDGSRYFFVLDNGVCNYAVFEKGGFVGSYPAAKIINGFGSRENFDSFTLDEFKEFSFEELYEKSASLFD